MPHGNCSSTNSANGSCWRLCFLVGHYEMVAMALNSLGVEPEPTTLHRLETDTAKATATLRQTLVRAVDDTRSRGR